MDNTQNENKPLDSDSNALETLDDQTTVVTTTSTEPDASGSQTTESTSPEEPKIVKKRRYLRGFADRFNIYLLLFLLIIVIAVIGTGISYMKASEDSKKQNAISTEPLSEEALRQLRQSDVKVGDPKQILSVESNAVFAGKVLIRDSLEVAGQLKVGGPLNLPGLTVSGASNIDQANVNNLQVAGKAVLQGPLNVQNNLTVSGSGTFGGTLTAARINIQNLLITGDLQINRHIDAGGGTPGKSDGSALGAGGTSSISGTDTAGTIAINTGSGGGVGCFVTVNFTQKFNGTPHVVITPVGSAAGSLNWYINRSTTNFSVCTASAAPGGQSFAFDYVAID